MNEVSLYLKVRQFLQAHHKSLFPNYGKLKEISTCIGSGTGGVLPSRGRATAVSHPVSVQLPNPSQPPHPHQFSSVDAIYPDFTTLPAAASFFPSTLATTLSLDLPGEGAFSYGVQEGQMPGPYAVPALPALFSPMHSNPQSEYSVPSFHAPEHQRIGDAVQPESQASALVSSSSRRPLLISPPASGSPASIIHRSQSYDSKFRGDVLSAGLSASSKRRRGDEGPISDDSLAPPPSPSLAPTVSALTGMTATMKDLLNSMQQMHTELKEMRVKLLPNQSAIAEGAIKTASEYLSQNTTLTDQKKAQILVRLCNNPLIAIAMPQHEPKLCDAFLNTLLHPTTTVE